MRPLNQTEDIEKMDHMEMVERLREKTGLSYEEARAALERSNWDLLDALVALEKEGKVSGGAAHYSTRTDAQPDAANDKKTHTEGDSFSDIMKRFWNWIRRVLQASVHNQLCMLDKNGQQVLAIPVILFVLLILFAFWVILPLMIVSLFFGCRYLFRGPDLGKESVNKVVGKATDVADTIKAEFKDGSQH